MKTDLQDKTAIVTGGGSGIGAAIAVALSNQGCNLVICGRRLEPLQKVAALIESDGKKCVVVAADISKENDVEKVVQTTIQHFERVDILVNNAGISKTQPIHAHDIDTWDDVLNINLRGAFLFSRAVLAGMREQKSGQILNIASECGMTHFRYDGAYGISKHAMIDLAEYISKENQKYNIRVSTISPAWVYTEMTNQIEGLDPEKCLQPQDLAEMAVHLLTLPPHIRIANPVWMGNMQNPMK